MRDAVVLAAESGEHVPLSRGDVRALHRDGGQALQRAFRNVRRGGRGPKMDQDPAPAFPVDLLAKVVRDDRRGGGARGAGARGAQRDEQHTKDHVARHREHAPLHSPLQEWTYWSFGPAPRKRSAQRMPNWRRETEGRFQTRTGNIASTSLPAVGQSQRLGVDPPAGGTPGSAGAPAARAPLAPSCAGPGWAQSPARARGVSEPPPSPGF